MGTTLAQRPGPLQHPVWRRHDRIAVLVVRTAAVVVRTAAVVVRTANPAVPTPVAVWPQSNVYSFHKTRATRRFHWQPIVRLCPDTARHPDKEAIKRKNPMRAIYEITPKINSLQLYAFVGQASEVLHEEMGNRPNCPADFTSINWTISLRKWMFVNMSASRKAVGRKLSIMWGDLSYP